MSVRKLLDKPHLSPEHQVYRIINQVYTWEIKLIELRPQFYAKVDIILMYEVFNQLHVHFLSEELLWYWC